MWEEELVDLPIAYIAGISWESAGGYPYWAVPLQACSTLTYALLTTAWCPLNFGAQLICQFLKSKF